MTMDKSVEQQAAYALAFARLVEMRGELHTSYMPGDVDWICNATVGDGEEIWACNADPAAAVAETYRRWKEDRDAGE